jgi:hypothetical protein
MPPQLRPHRAAGEITPARAVDLVASDSGVAVIDIRPLKEKSAAGTPDVPSSARGRFLELEVAEIDRRLRGQLRNVDSVEAQVRPRSPPFLPSPPSHRSLFVHSSSREMLVHCTLHDVHAVSPS